MTSLMASLLAPAEAPLASLLDPRLRSSLPVVLRLDETSEEEDLKIEEVESF